MYEHFSQATPRPDLVIYLQATPATLAERIKRRGIQSESSISDNYLERICESYSRFFHQYESTPLLMVNAEKLNPIERSEDFDLLMQKNEKIVMLTSYDASFSSLIDECGVEVILVGDSMGMVIQGHSSTLPVTIDEIVYHTTCVARGVTSSMVLAD